MAEKKKKSSKKVTQKDIAKAMKAHKKADPSSTLREGEIAMQLEKKRKKKKAKKK